MLEQYRVPPYVTAKGLLRLLGRMNGLKGKELSERVEYVLKLVELADKSKITAKQYSKGMIVRLGIAQAILHKPSLLFLDEPTDALDPLGKIMVRNLLVELANQGVTIILNSHLLSEVELIAHRAAILHEGRLIKIGKLADLLSSQSGFIIEISQYVDLSPKYECKNDNKNWVIEVDTTQKLQELLQLLNNKGMNPIYIVPKRTTLEDIFIKTIEEQ